MNEAHTPFAPRGSSLEVETGSQFQPKFGPDGLIATITVDATSGDVLMFAWMTPEALSATLETGIAHFWSRSRQKLWRKGEESGNTLEIADIRTDCDQDALVLRVRVKGAGVACHTGAKSCFYRTLHRVPETGAVMLRRTGG
jgi:phosphoribosyl-AMP cyclohydrolase